MPRRHLGATGHGLQADERVGLDRDSFNAARFNVETGSKIEQNNLLLSNNAGIEC
jgi:hypothetical protein